MPFVRVSVGRELSESEREAVCGAVAKNITIIPGKTVAATMVEIADGRATYKNAERKPCAFIEARLYGAAPEESKSELCARLIADVSAALALPAENIYLNIVEMEHWGKNGEWC